MSQVRFVPHLCSGFIRPLEAGDAAELQRQASVDNSLSAEATLPLPAAEPVAAEAAGPTSAAAAAPAAALAAPAARTGLRSKAGGRFGSRARRASPTTTGAPTAAGQQGAAPVAQLQSPTPASRGASKSSTPSKQASRQLPKTPDAANPGGHTPAGRAALVGFPHHCQQSQLHFQHQLRMRGLGAFYASSCSQLHQSIARALRRAASERLALWCLCPTFCRLLPRTCAAALLQACAPTSGA